MKLKSCLIAMALIVGMALPAQATEVRPDFSAKSTDGLEHSLSKHRGKVVVMEWNNPECPFVKKFYDSGKMQELQKDATANGVIWLTINSSAEGKQGNLTAKKANDWMSSQKAVPTGYILDPSGEIGKIYGARTTPHMVVFDKGGDLAYHGAIDDKPSTDPEDIKTAKNYVTAALENLAAGKPVEVRSSTAYGCAVKYGD